MDRSGATIQFNARDPSHQRMGKGIAFTHQETERLHTLLGEYPDGPK